MSFHGVCSADGFHSILLRLKTNLAAGVVESDVIRQQPAWMSGWNGGFQ